jgi:predicted nucleic acid-binding protein
VEPVEKAQLPDGALVLLDSAPIIFVLEHHPRQASRYLPLFERHQAGAIRFAVTTVSIAEVLVGPLKARREALAKRYRAVMESWLVVDLTADIAESAARLRASLGLRIADAVQASSAIAVNADALVTHDRDFSRFSVLPVLS